MSCHVCGVRDRRSGRRDCSTCHWRAWAVKNPLRVAWGNLRKSAKRRALPFALPFEEFVAMATVAGYVTGLNRGASGLSVHRVNSSRGYESGNVCFLSRGGNSIVGRRDLSWDDLAEVWQETPF